MIVSFSGTGNSRYVAQRLAQPLSDELFDAGGCIKTYYGLTAQMIQHEIITVMVFSFNGPAPYCAGNTKEELLC